MKFNIYQPGSTQSMFSHTCVMEHNGKELEWDITKLSRTPILTKNASGDSVDESFKEFNMFMETLPEEKQDELWDIYVDIHEYIDTVFDIEKLTKLLQKSVKCIYDVLIYEDINDFMIKNDLIIVPESIMEDYTETSHFKEATYLKSHYRDLISLVVTLRPMVPIWGKWLQIIYSPISPNFKEYYALKILFQTDLFETPPVKRLQSYISKMLDGPIDNGAAILEGLGTAELEEYMLANIFIRRLAVGEVNSDKPSHLIGNVYGYISNNIQRSNRKFGGARSKIPKSAGGTGEEDPSNLERYKIKPDVTTFDIELPNVYALDTLLVAQGVAGDIPEELVTACITNASSLTVDLSQHHMLLCQWILANTIAVNSIPSLRKDSLLSCIAACQAILWHWGFKDIAILMTATEFNSDDYFDQSAKERITAAQLEVLEEIFPYSVKEDTARKSNPAYIAIGLLAKTTQPRQWLSNHPAFMEEFYQSIRLAGSDCVAAPPAFARQLADLIIKLNRG